MTVIDRSGGAAVGQDLGARQDRARMTVWRGTDPNGKEFPLEELSEIKDDPEVLYWVDLLDVHDGDDTVLKQLQEELGLTEKEVVVAVDNGLRPKAARHASHTFITTYATSMDRDTQGTPLDSRVVTSRISAFLLPRGLVTVRHDHVDVMEKLRKRWKTDTHLRRLGSGALLYVLFDLLVDEQFETINVLEDEIEELEATLFAMLDPEKKQGRGDLREANRQLQLDVFRLRKELVALRRVVLPMREVVNIVDHDPLGGAKDKQLDELYDELSEQILRLTEWTDSLHDMVTAVYETNLSVQDAQLNLVMQKLTGWAAIIAVPTLITGWFGQNVTYPGANASSGLVASTVMIIALAVPLWYFFKKHHWI